MGSNPRPSAPTKEQEDLEDELEWIRFQKENLGPGAYGERPGSKFWRKLKENPFVPIGALVTLGTLSYGLWCFRKGRVWESQLMMRARIAAQGFTVFAILGGVTKGSPLSGKTSNPESAPAEPAPAKPWILK